MPVNERYKILFEPVKIGPVTAKNRFFQVPHAMGAGNDMPNTRAAMRGIKAEGGWGVVNTGYCSIHPSCDDRPLPFARLWSDQDIAAHVPMVEAVHEHGALAGIEFFHGGGLVPNRHTRITPVSPSGIHEMYSEVEYMGLLSSKVMTKKDIQELKDWHVAAAKRAQQASFDIVYVYAGMGFLPYHFLHPSFNTRIDEYGGSLENRSRLLKEIILDMKEAVGDTCAIAVRLSTDELLSFQGESGVSECHELFGLLGELPDLWDLKLSTWVAECPSGRFSESGFMEPYVSFAKELTTKPIVGVGWFTSPDIMVSQVKNGILDLVGSARASIADPFLPKKIEEGREDEIRECIGCNICASCYNQGIPVRCTQNPTMGEEWRRGWHPEKMKPKTSEDSILVIGGGPAGLEATLSLARRGYEVTLADDQKELGGRINKESILPGMSSYQRVTDYRVSQIQQLRNVNIFLENELTATDVIELGFDHVVTATGCHWQTSQLSPKSVPVPLQPADNIFTPDDILNGAELLSPVIIFDFDYYYMGGLMAEYLANKGLDVTIVTPFNAVSPWSVMSNEHNSIEVMLSNNNIKVITHHLIQEIKDQSVTLIRKLTNEIMTIQMASLVTVGNRAGNDALFNDLNQDPSILKEGGIKSIQNIGDSNAPGAVVHAVYAGHMYANTFDSGIDDDPYDFKFEYPVIQ